MAFPVPSLLTAIEELLYEVQWLDGIIFVSEFQRATFVSVSQLGSLLGRLRDHPRGSLLAERLCMSLSETHDRASVKPVLVLQRDGGFWLGLMGVGDKNFQREKAISHLNRCLELMT